jgi:4-amino-4-deoxy-L-arabinose transferase-like glycosyltransferase
MFRLSLRLCGEIPFVVGSFSAPPLAAVLISEFSALMGAVNPVPAKEKTLAEPVGNPAAASAEVARTCRRQELLVVLIAAVIFLGGILSPPSLMDDVDGGQSQIARHMLESGDWVTPRLDGIVYLEKAPLKHWMTAVSFAIFGVHDWAARLPVALGAILLCWVVIRFGRWAFSPNAGFYAGLALATCVGLFLFTRVVIPDVILTLAMTSAVGSLLRALDDRERHPRRWAWLLAVSLAAGVLLKGLIGVVFPLGAGFAYLLLTRQLLARRTWQRLHVFTGLGIFLAIALPWHVLAILRNPPHLVFAFHSQPFVWRGFFWFYFINEHVLRFLNQRYPRDYATVPRLWFWLLNVLWLFPWSAYLPAVGGLGYRPVDRAGRVRLMALCWIGCVMLFFTFSTTQEYYSMPIYPALALLIGCAMAGDSPALRQGTKMLAAVSALLAVAVTAVLALAWTKPAPGDISRALTTHPQAYTLSLGHMGDLTLDAFAYLKLPLALAALAFAAGALGAWRLRRERAFLALALMMVLFFHAARLALVTFDPYMSSRPLAEALNRAPRGRLVIADEYYVFSSVFFYTNYDALIFGGRHNNLEYGSYAPGAPHVFITGQDFARLWAGTGRCYLAVEDRALPKLLPLAGRERLHAVAAGGGKTLYTNLPLPNAG